MSTDFITCAHCRSDVPRGASVCRGCHAEIKYGPPPFYLLMCFMGPLGVGMFFCQFLHKAFAISERPLDILWAIITVVGFIFLVKACYKICGNDVRFIREKKN